MKGISSFEEIVNYNYFSSKMESQSETSREKARKASRELIKSRNDTSGKVRPIFVSLNLREWSMNVISRFTIRWDREIRDWQSSLFFVILSEKLANCCVISSEIAKIRGIGHEWNLTIWNWSKTWFREMLNIAFECEFTVNVNSPSHH